MVRFIDDHRDVYGVELMCAAAPIALSSYFLHKAQYADPTQRSARAWVTTTQAVPDAGRLPDLVARDFTATRPNQLWVFDFTYVATWRASASLRTDLALDALEQAIYDRCDDDTGDLVHHGDRGTQYLSIRDTERLADAGIELSVGSTGDAFDNVFAETVVGLFKTEVIQKQGPWRSIEAVEFEAAYYQQVAAAAVN